MENLDHIRQSFQDLFPSSDELKTEMLRKEDREVLAVYLASLCDPKVVKESVKVLFMESRDAEDFKMRFEVIGAVILHAGEDRIAKLMRGHVLLFGAGKAYALDARKITVKSPPNVKMETTVQGPQTAITEDIKVSLSIIRNRYPRPELRVESMTIGTLTKTEVAIVYDYTRVNPVNLKLIKERLDSVKVEVLNSAEQLSLLINNRRFSLFPDMIFTERPDRITLNLGQGKIVIMVQGTPFALVAPAVFFDFMAAMDDQYQSYFVTHLLITLRYIGLFLSISLPALYIAAVSFDPEFFRIQLSLSIAGSRTAVPYPSFIEVMIMMFLIEALTESSIRLPKFIGPTATTVGGLILGQAAVQAGMTSSYMIIITSAVAISNFVIPINAMTFGMRVVKYPIIVLATFFGIVGITAGVFCLIVYLANIRSFGEPYLQLFRIADKVSREDQGSGRG